MRTNGRFFVITSSLLLDFHLCTCILFRFFFRSDRLLSKCLTSLQQQQRNSMPNKRNSRVKTELNLFEKEKFNIKSNENQCNAVFCCLAVKLYALSLFIAKLIIHATVGCTCVFDGEKYLYFMCLAHTHTHTYVCIRQNSGLTQSTWPVQFLCNLDA